MSDEGSTVEWGDTAVDELDRPRWWRRWSAPPDASGAARPRRLAPAALGCAAAGFALVLAAELLPWMRAELPAADPSLGATGRGLELGIDQLNSWQVLIYNPGWTLVFAALAVALAAPPAWRRPVVALGLAACAGQVVLLLGLAKTVRHGGGLSDRISGDVSTTMDSGLYAAFAALLLLAGALVLCVWTPRRRDTGRASDAERGDGRAPAGPVDLRVLPAEPFASDDGRR
jgi:hypothetical protein